MLRTISCLLIVSLIFMAGCGKSNQLNPVICSALVTDTAGTNDSGIVYMPTAFTPNNNGLNDICRPVVNNKIASVKYTIYDASNNIVYTNDNWTAGSGWAGDNTYVNAKYYFSLQAVTKSNKKIGICGEVYQILCMPRYLTPKEIFFQDEVRDDVIKRGVSYEWKINSKCPF